MGESRRSKVVLMTAFSGDNESVVQVQYDLFLRKPFEDIMKVIKQVEELVCD
jgi:hypothetical protein